METKNTRVHVDGVVFIFFIVQLNDDQSMCMVHAVACKTCQLEYQKIHTKHTWYMARTMKESGDLWKPFASARFLVRQDAGASYEKQYAKSADGPAMRVFRCAFESLPFLHGALAVAMGSVRLG